MYLLGAALYITNNMNSDVFIRSVELYLVFMCFFQAMFKSEFMEELVSVFTEVFCEMF